MKAGDELLSTVFSKDHRYIIPIFQRPYVWNEEDNWIPLWNDLRKAAEEVEHQANDAENDDPPEYFLGAFVTQHRSPVPRRKPTSMVIDGQQRMTTIQVFMAAARRVADELGARQAADNFAALVRNRVSSDSEFPEDRFKVAPLDHDREAFEWAVREPGDAGGASDPSHRLVQAALWFEESLRDWANESARPEERLDLLHFAVENRVKVVSIFLDAKDDPQVIFEALNHRGVRLDAADLVKNLLFQTLSRQGDGQQERELLERHWSLLDSGAWRTVVTTGRIKRVRVDTLLAYWLSAQRGEESSVEHLFEDFKRWLRVTDARAAHVIRSIRTYADTMDRLRDLPMTSPVAQVLDRLDATGTTTPWPLILFLHAEAGVPDDQATVGTMAIDSFIMRRAICRLSTKDYTRLFGSILGVIKAGEIDRAGDLLVDALASHTAEGRYWPSDGDFYKALVGTDLYNGLVRARLRTLLVGLENQLITDRSEQTIPHRSLTKNKQLTIEHIMPVKWQENWPLEETATEEDGAQRNAVVHTLGNLTLATRPLNSTLSNDSWVKKRLTLQSHSLVRLTTASVLTCPQGAQDFTQGRWIESWEENRIARRGSYLAQLALSAWPRPLIDAAEESASISKALSAPTDGGVAEPDTPDTPEPSQPKSARTRVDHPVSGDLLPLIVNGLVVPGDRLRHVKVRTGEQFHATVTAAGGVTTSQGTFQAPSPALTQLLGSSRNGWKDWTHVPTGKSLADLRAML